MNEWMNDVGITWWILIKINDDDYDDSEGGIYDDDYNDEISRIMAMMIYQWGWLWYND